LANKSFSYFSFVFLSVMNVRFLCATLVCALAVPAFALQAQTKETGTISKVTSAPASSASKTKTSKPIKGTVVSLLTFKTVKSEEAESIKGALALQVGSRIYYVVKSDGSSAGEDLARLADAQVGVVGRLTTRNGISVLVADMIETMK
jgi:hypothetical protein